MLGTSLSLNFPFGERDLAVEMFKYTPVQALRAVIIKTYL